ncbi:radical SAM protein [Methanobacterium petrolearium]|uniref:radical SAM protein n=1 Tax=Methanobacterium petrolearium TaxID=710190 RepID=UPI001AE91648|nr:radical SAM protein [Methanobacterium petrolearium]MBP1945996.1 pyruvate formate lyase activating enzyme [Methanobacterium petrolearium]
MAIYKISYSKEFKRANIHNYGCNFNCTWCSYKLGNHPKPDRFLDLGEIKEVLSRMDIEWVHFVGGEVSTYPLLEEVADFSKNVLGVRTKIGHSNGYNLPPESIDAISISIKSLSEDFYIKYTGKSNKSVLENFQAVYERGIEVDASSVYIPELIDHDEIEEIVTFIADIDPKIPYHITGYIPVPGTPWRTPTWDEITKAQKIAENYLEQVEVSWFSSFEDYLKMISKNPLYQKVTVV